MNILNMQGLTIVDVITPLGSLGVTNQYDKLKEDLATLLMTRIGTVLGNPNYGSYLHDILFELGNDSTITRAKTEINRVLTEHYNFINEVDTDCTLENNNLNISIMYTTLNSNLGTRLEFNIPISSEGGIDYERDSLR